MMFWVKMPTGEGIVLSTNRPPVAVHLMRLINYLVTATTGYCISANKVTF